MCAAFAIALGVTGLVTGLSAVPAYAAPTDLSIAASNDVNLTVGGDDQRVTFTVSNQGAEAEDIEVDIDVPLGGQGVRIVHGPDGCRLRGGTSLRCEIERMARNDSEQLFIRLTPPDEGGPGPGETREGRGEARVSYREDPFPDNNRDRFKVTLRGEEKPQGVTSVSGTVKDSKTQKPVGNARIEVKDSAGNKHTTATNKKGHYEVTPSGDKQIAPGQLEISFSKDGYEPKTFRKAAKEGGKVTVDMLVIAKPKASGSPTPSPSASTSSSPVPPVKPGDAASDEAGTPWWVWLLYLVAALLVLGGIATMVWLFRRRDEDEEAGYGEAPGAGPAPAGARGVYHDPYGDPTAVRGGTHPTTVMGHDAPTSRFGPGYDQPTSMIDRPGYDQPTSMMRRPGYEEPTRSHPAPPADDVYPAGREHYADGSGPDGYGSGYGQPGYRQDPGAGRHTDHGERRPGRPSPRPGGGRHSGYPEDRRLDWYKD